MLRIAGLATLALLALTGCALGPDSSHDERLDDVGDWAYLDELDRSRVAWPEPAQPAEPPCSAVTVTPAETAVSPDRSMVAYFRGDALFVAAEPGCKPRKLATGVSLSGHGGPSWSRDGRRIHFGDDVEPGRFRLRAVTLQGDPVRLAFPAEGVTPWDENERGDVLLAVRRTRRLYLQRGDGSRRHIAENVWSAGFAPDGRTIVYTVVGGGVYLVANLGEGPKRLVSGAVHRAWHPTFSTDGRKLVFADATEQIWVVDADGRGLRRVGDVRCEHGHELRGSPDGRFATCAVSYRGILDDEARSRMILVRVRA